MRSSRRQPSHAHALCAGAGVSPGLRARAQIFFPRVYCAKPKSSRNSSVEAFVVAQGFRLPPGFSPGSLAAVSTQEYRLGQASTPAEQLLVPFVACGDLSGFDADQNYPLQPLAALAAKEPLEGARADEAYVFHEPVQGPTTPAYRDYMEHQQRAQHANQPAQSEPGDAER